MKKLLLRTILLALAIIVPIPKMGGIDINARISLLPTIVFEARPEVIMMPDTIGVFFAANADADAPKDSPKGRDEKQQDPSLETGKPTGPKNESNWKINLWPAPDNMKTPLEMKQENKHTPPDRP
jgi:hypothetical protein